MTAEETLLEWGYEDVVIFYNPSYDDALIGVTTDNRAVYDYDLMVNWLIKHEGFECDEAVEWIEYNTIGSLPYGGEAGPIIVHRLPEHE